MVEPVDYARSRITRNFESPIYKRRLSRQTTVYGEFVPRPRSFLQEEFKDIFTYLKNPVGTGVWHLQGRYSRNGDNDIIEYLETAYLRVVEKNLSPSRESIDDIKRQRRVEFPRSLEFLLRFFLDYVIDGTRTEDDEKNSTPPVVRSRSITLMLRGINRTEFENIFGDALKIFVDKIYDEAHILTTHDSSIIKLRTGHVCKYDQNENLLSIFSLDRDSANSIKLFLESLSVIENARLVKSFSPAEVVFTPYIPYLKEAYPGIVDYLEFNRSFDIAISEFEQESYPHCINTIAILTEHILTQIYETIFREETDEKLTIGELYYKIQKQVDEVVAPDRQEANVDYNSLFKEIENIISNIGTSTDEETHRKTLDTLRRFIHQQKDKNSYLKGLIKQSVNPERNMSIFPRERSAKINELLRYRNAIAHKSKIPISKYEATRSVYCCFTLYCWWKETLETVDWTNSKEEVIKFLVDESKKSNSSNH